MGSAGGRRGGRSAHLEQFVVELLRRQPQGEQIAPQGLAEGCRAAEPDIGLAPLWHGGGDALGVEQAVTRIPQHMQVHPGRLGVAIEQADGVGIVFRRGME